MASCLVDVHIWSLRTQNILIHDDDIACFTYHDKQEGVSTDHPYLQEKIQYTEGRNLTWTPKNKRPEKLKDTLRETEDLLSIHKCVACKWLSRRAIQMVLSNGIIVTVMVSIHTGDVDRILIDKTLVGKLSADNPSDVLWTDNYMVFCYPDQPKLDFVCFMKKPEPYRRLEKISVYDPRVTNENLPGPVGRKLKRQLACNLHQDMVMCWWSMATEEAQPWSPMSGDRERANLVLYGVSGTQLGLVSFLRTDCDPVSAIFSMINPQHIYILEQSTASGGEKSIDSCVYECTRNKVHKLSITTIALRSGVVCQERNPMEDKVLLGCEDASLVLYDERRKITQMTSAAFTPSVVRWHPTGTIAVIANTKGHIQVFDMALASLLVQTVSENPCPTKALNLASYFRSPAVLGHIEWSPVVELLEDRLPECNDSIFMAFERGPLVMVQYYLGVLSQGHLSPLSLVTQYIKHRQLEQAINVLAGLSWDSEGRMCLACISAIANHLLRGPLNATSEGQLEATLGTFYAPPRPLSESTVLEYRDAISRLARRFFHLLLRFTRFEKAFLLAVDIGARDLFMDLHYVAKDKGETALAEVSRNKADQIDGESRASGSLDDSDGSEVSTDGSVDSYSGSDEEYIEGAPPRPPRQTGMNQGLGKPLPPPPPAATMTHIPAHYNQPSMYENVAITGPSYYRAAQPFTSTQHLLSSSRDSAFSPVVPSRRGPYLDISQVLLNELEADLAASTPSVYAEALFEEPILPPPPSHADDPSTDQQASSTPSKVKVIHFGIV